MNEKEEIKEEIVNLLEANKKDFVKMIEGQATKAETLGAFEERNKKILRMVERQECLENLNK